MVMAARKGDREPLKSVSRGQQDGGYATFPATQSAGQLDSSNSQDFSSRPFSTDHQQSRPRESRLRKAGPPSYMQKVPGRERALVSSDTFLVVPMETGTLGQSSLVAIFSLWANMLGGGLIVLPWAMAQSGVGPGVAFVLLSTFVLLYTCRLIVQRMHDASVGGAAADFSEVCRCYLGKWGERASNLGLCLNDFWTLAAHWILISNFTFYTVALASDPVRMDNETVRDFLPAQPMLINCMNDSSRCPPQAGEALRNISLAAAPFLRTWTLEKNVPAFLALLIFPLLHIRQPLFFAKFNSLVFMSTSQILLFLVVMAASLGCSECARSAVVSTGSGWRFPAVVGIIMFSMNAHSSVIEMMRTQRRPTSNMRDVNIAFACTAATYLLLGLLFGVFFPNAASCTQKIFLDNFSFDNLAAFSIRMIVAIQLITTFPLRAYTLRVRVLHAMCGLAEISVAAMFAFNCVTTVSWILITQYVADAADVMRYTGAGAGLVTQIVLPLACQLLFLNNNLLLSYSRMGAYAMVVLASVAVLAGQFTVT